MKYKKKPIGESGQQNYDRIDDDGKIRIQCTGENPEFKEWVAAGNTPEAAD